MLLLFRAPIIAANLKSTLMATFSSTTTCYICDFFLMPYRLVNPYVQPALYIRKPGDDHEQVMTFPDDDPFFSEISNLIDVVEDIEEDPEAAQILSSYEGKTSESSVI